MKKVFCFAVSHYLSTLSTSCAALVCVDMLAMYRRAAGQSENPLRPKTYNYFAGELMEQGLLHAWKISIEFWRGFFWHEGHMCPS